MSKNRAVDDFRERLEAGDPVATVIRDVVELHDLHLMLYHYELLPNGIGCVRILEQIHREGWPGALWDVLDYIMTRDTGSKERFSEANIRAAYCAVRDERIDKFLEESSQTKGPATHSATNESPAEPVEPHSYYNRPAGGVQEENEAMTISSGWTSVEDGISEDDRNRMTVGCQQLWLPVNLLVIDSDYQRPVRPTEVEYLVENWNPDAIGSFLVHYRSAEDRFILFDGQQRKAAIEQLGLGHKEVPCVVYYNRTKEWEASTFRDTNRDRSNLTPGQVIRAEYMAANKPYVNLLQMLRDIGLTLPESGVTFGKLRHIDCPGLLMEIIEKDGVEIARDVLTIAGSAWREGDDLQEGLRMTILRAIWMILRRHREALNKDRFVQKLSQTSPLQFLRTGRNFKHANGGSVANHIAAAMLMEYNKSLRNRLDWPERKSKSAEDGE